MNQCIFAPHCTEQLCDKSCPIYTETSYLLERNGITINNPVFNAPAKDIDKALRILKQSSNSLKIVSADDNTSAVANLLTYCAICENWQGNRMHCTVYNLKFSTHIEAIQKSWNMKNPSDSVEYQQIWSQTAKVLIISSIDFVQFKDFQAQTLLNLVHTRKNDGLTTIIVSPNIHSLIGSGQFFNRLQLLMEQKGMVITW